MTTDAYTKFVNDGFNTRQLRRELQSKYPEIPQFLLEMSGEELQWVINRAFATVRSSDASSSKQTGKRRHNMPLLAPQVDLKEYAAKNNIEHHGNLEVHRIFVTSPDDAQSESFKTEVFNHDISVIEGLSSNINFNMDLFQTKELARSRPKYKLDIRLQDKQPGGINLDSEGKPTWAFTSQHGTRMSLRAFEKYQSEQLKISVMSDTEPQSEVSSPPTPTKTGKSSLDEKIKFGTNFDLKETSRWSRQLQELQKLPSWMQHESAESMLSTRYTGPPIEGMNQIQLFLKVPGCRTPGHQENNVFCSVNLNVGPQDTEWFAVPESCWLFVEGMCRRQGLNFLSGAWWPNLADLEALGCPYYRFKQKPGEFVFVGVGCVHWVQAAGVCNNIAWNVGPFEERQYEAAMERYEWNKLERFQSLVPMTFLSWRLATDEQLTWGNIPGFVSMIQKTLAQSLINIFKVTSIVKSSHPSVPCFRRPRTPDSKINYCGVCSEELFHVFFILNQPDLSAYETLCYSCAKKDSSDLSKYGLVEEYDIFELIQKYNLFIMKWRPDLRHQLTQKNGHDHQVEIMEVDSNEETFI